MEAAFIQEALRRTRNRRNEAANLLGISRRTLQRKLARPDGDTADTGADDDDNGDGAD